MIFTMLDVPFYFFNWLFIYHVTCLFIPLIFFYQWENNLFLLCDLSLYYCMRVIPVAYTSFINKFLLVKEILNTYVIGDQMKTQWYFKKNKKYKIYRRMKIIIKSYYNLILITNNMLKYWWDISANFLLFLLTERFVWLFHK